MAEKTIKQKFTKDLPSYHVHVYKVVSMCEFDMMYPEEKECLDGALQLARQAHDGELNDNKGEKWPVKNPDCEYVAVSFKYSDAKRSKF